MFLPKYLQQVMYTTETVFCLHLFSSLKSGESCEAQDGWLTHLQVEEILWLLSVNTGLPVVHYGTVTYIY